MTTWIASRSEANSAPSHPGPLSRVFHVQRVMATMGDTEQGPTAIAAAAGLSYAVVHRVLTAGVDAGAFERTTAGKYRLGSLGIELAMASAVGRFDPAARRQVLQDLVQATEAGACMIEAVALLGGTASVCLEVAGGERLDHTGLSRGDLLGAVRSFRYGAAGRAVLAGLPRTLANQIADEVLEAEYGPGVIRDRDEFLGAVARARRLGYAYSTQEVWAGWDCVAAPVRCGGVHGAVAVAKPTGEMSMGARVEAQQAIAAAARLEALLRGRDELGRP